MINLRSFYGVQFIELPFESVDDYVCVPGSWVKIIRGRDQKAVIAYPNNEDPFDTRDRAERREEPNDAWRCYMADVKFVSDTYREVEFWIATRNDYGPLVEPDSTMKVTRPLSVMFNSINQNYGISINKRQAQSDMSEQIIRKRLRRDEATSSNREQANSTKANLYRHLNTHRKKAIVSPFNYNIRR